MSYLHPILRDADRFLTRAALPRPSSPGPTELAAITDRFAAAAERWRPLVRHDPEQRWYTRLLRNDGVEVWLLGWSPGQQVPAHDHGGAAGAFTVVDGVLVEDRLDATVTTTTLRAGSRTWFGPAHVHVLGNRGTGPATSVHAYSPPGLPLRFQRPGAARDGVPDRAGSLR